MQKQIFFHLEDSRINQILFQKTFEDVAEVITAQSIGDALQMITDVPDIACFVIDYKLHDGNGLTFVKKIRTMKKYEIVPVILLTATLTDELEREAQIAGVNESLDKMISNIDLRKILAEQINNPHIKWNKGQEHRIPCVTYELNTKYYQFCPSIRQLVEADTPEKAEVEMRASLKEALSKGDSAIDPVHAISSCVHVIDE